MSVKFSMVKMRLGDDVKRSMYPKMMKCGTLDTAAVARTVQAATTFTESDVKGVLSALAAVVADKTAEGYSVRLDGLGIFSASLGFGRDVKPETGAAGEVKHRGQSIVVRNINFRASKALVGAADEHCRPQRTDKGGTHHSLSTCTKPQRLAMALKAMENGAVLMIKDYIDLTGLVYSTAVKELRDFSDDEKNNIRRIRLGSFTAYVLKREG